MPKSSLGASLTTSAQMIRHLSGAASPNFSAKKSGQLPRRQICRPVRQLQRCPSEASVADFSGVICRQSGQLRRHQSRREIDNFSAEEIANFGAAVWPGHFNAASVDDWASNRQVSCPRVLRTLRRALRAQGENLVAGGFPHLGPSDSSPRPSGPRRKLNSGGSFGLSARPVGLTA